LPIDSLLADLWRYHSKFQRINAAAQKIDFQTIIELSNEKLRLVEKLIAKKNENEITFELAGLNVICHALWAELIRSYGEKLLQTIAKRKTKGEEFAEIKRSVLKTIEDAKDEDEPLENLEHMFKDLVDYGEQITEKIDIEEHQNKQFWIGIILGFILGIIASIITYFVMPSK